MGDPIKIVDLAHNLIRLAGYVPNEDIKIAFSGLRPGEKLFEELFDKEERVEPTSHPKLRKAVLGAAWVGRDVEEAISAVLKAVRSRDHATLKDTLQRFIPSYRTGEGAAGVPRNGVHTPPREIDTEILPPVVVSNGSAEAPRQPSPAS
jgi:O-antigen biosynthesis protein WbqV